MQYINSVKVCYQPGQEVQVGHLYFKCCEIKHTVNYEGETYLVLPIIITRVGFFDMSQEALKGIENAVVFPWKRCNAVPGQMTYEDEVDDANIFAVLGIKLPEEYPEQFTVSGQWEINYYIESFRKEKLQIDCSLSKSQLSEIELHDPYFVKELKCSYQRENMLRKMKGFSTAAEYARQEKDSLFAAAYEGNLLKLAECIYELPGGIEGILSELYEAFFAVGYGAMQIETAHLTFYPDWDGCVGFLVAYLKGLIADQCIRFDPETSLLEEVYCPEQVLDVEEIKEFYENVCQKTGDDYYERWIHALMETASFPGWQDEKEELYGIIAQLFYIYSKPLKAWEITALLVEEADRSGVRYEDELEKLEDDNFMVNGKVEDKEVKIRRAKAVAYDMCLMDCCSYDEQILYGAFLEEMNHAEELEEVAYVSAKISWLTGKYLLFPYTLYKMVLEDSL